MNDEEFIKDASDAEANDTPIAWLIAFVIVAILVFGILTGG